MVAFLDEWRAAKRLLLEEAESLGIEPPEAGIMVEVPAAAARAGLFAADCDFFSIGTNDLTQYVLAMDRGHPALASRLDALDPAVLSMIDAVVRGAAPFGRKVGVCGGLASDPAAVPVLLGLGVDKLSVPAPVLPSIKAAVRRLRLEHCRDLASQALRASCAAEVRRLVAGASADGRPAAEGPDDGRRDRGGSGAAEHPGGAADRSGPVTPDPGAADDRKGGRA